MDFPGFGSRLPVFDVLFKYASAWNWVAGLLPFTRKGFSRRYGSGLDSTASTALNMAVLAPMPSASVSVKIGVLAPMPSARRFGDRVFHLCTGPIRCFWFISEEISEGRIVQTGQ